MAAKETMYCKIELAMKACKTENRFLANENRFAKKSVVKSLISHNVPSLDCKKEWKIVICSLMKSVIFVEVDLLVVV